MIGLRKKLCKLLRLVLSQRSRLYLVKLFTSIYKILPQILTSTGSSQTNSIYLLLIKLLQILGKLKWSLFLYPSTPFPRSHFFFPVFFLLVWAPELNLNVLAGIVWKICEGEVYILYLRFSGPTRPYKTSL